MVTIELLYENKLHEEIQIEFLTTHYTIKWVISLPNTGYTSPSGAQVKDIPMSLSYVTCGGCGFVYIWNGYNESSLNRP